MSVMNHNEMPSPFCHTERSRSVDSGSHRQYFFSMKDEIPDQIRNDKNTYCYKFMIIKNLLTSI